MLLDNKKANETDYQIEQRYYESRAYDLTVSNHCVNENRNVIENIENVSLPNMLFECRQHAGESIKVSTENGSYLRN